MSWADNSALTFVSAEQITPRSHFAKGPSRAGKGNSQSGDTRPLRPRPARVCAEGRKSKSRGTLDD